MKKILALLTVAAVLLATTVSAQSTTPRFGTTPNQDNTGRVLTYKFVGKTDVAGADTLKTIPSAWHTIYRVALLDSLAIQPTSLTKCYVGDQITVIASGTSGDFIKFIGSNWISAGNATLSTGLRAVVRFVFDGAKWVEVSRVVQ